VSINFAVDKNLISKKFKTLSEPNFCCQQLSILLQVLDTRPVVTAQSCCFGRVQQAFLLFALKPATCQALTSEEPLRQVLPEEGGSSLLVKKLPVASP
jgi:hypothetical protein